MKLYTNPLSPFAARCRLQIALKNLDIALVSVPEECSGKELAAKSPIAKIPVLETDKGDIIPESEVICEYLEQRFPSPALVPETPEDQAKVRVLSRVADLYLMEPLGPLFTQLHPKYREQAIVDRELAELKKGLSRLNQLLPPQHPFAFGNSLTLADCSLAPILYFVAEFLPLFDGEAEKTQPFAAWENVHFYWQAIQKENNVKQVLNDIRQALAAKRGASKKTETSS